MQPRVPNPVSGVDVMALPLSTKEGFVLSRVDGTSSVEDISIMSGIEQRELLSILDRLHELGAVELSWRPKMEATKKSPPKPRGPFRAPFADPPPPYDPRELEEEVAISIEVRRTIVEAYHALDGKTHYQLLGVAETAEKKEIRNAYFELSKVFHPDSQFGKDLGSYKRRMEAVFKALTEAYEVLGKKRKRAEYDEYLMTTAATRRADDSLRRSHQAMEAVRPPAPEQPAKVEPERAAPPPGTRRVISQRPPGASPDERRARVRNRIRDRLRQVTGKAPPEPSVAPPPRPSQPPPASGGASSERPSVADDLRRSVRSSGEVSGGGDPDQRLKRHVLAAKEAEAAGDLLTASHELQLALSIQPGNRTLSDQYARVSGAVQRGLADNYEKQARYEEKQGKWASAASSWMRVSDGRPEDGAAAQAAAENLLKADGDLHLAQKYAQKALNADPDDVARLTLLARVYLAAGLKLNAVRELEKAAKLDREDEMVKNLLREARA